MFVNPNLIYSDAIVFCSFPRLFVCLRMRMSSSQQYANVHVKSIFKYPGPLRECRLIWSGASGLPYYCAPLVCVPGVIGFTDFGNKVDARASHFKHFVKSGPH